MCHIAHTTPETLRLIRENVHRSPMYTGRLRRLGLGIVRPIEDRLCVFPEKTRIVFLEPEGLIRMRSTSNGHEHEFADGVQAAMVHSIQGWRMRRCCGQVRDLSTTRSIDGAGFVRFG